MLKKKLVKLFVLIFVTFVVARAEAQDACTIKYQNNIRAGAGLKHEIVSKVPRFTPLKIDGSSGSWFKVTGHNFKGWAHKMIINQKIDCVIPLNAKELECPGHNLKRRQKFVKGEGFKIIKNELGCSKVKDRFGNKLYIFTGNVWPQDNVKTIEI